HGLCHDQGIRSHASPAQRTGSPLVPAARHQGRGAPCGESFWHWALGADGGHGHAQPPFRSSRLIGAERQPTSDCRQSLQQSPRRSPRMNRLSHPRTLIVVLVLPLLVVGLGMWALSGRVDRLDTVPAAVVNLDEGAEIENADGETQTVPFGRLLAGALTQPGTVDGQQAPSTTGFDW